jgi:hypothetical protein
MTGRSSAAEIDARVAGLTVPKQFAQLADRHPDSVLLRALAGDDDWTEYTIAPVRSPPGCGPTVSSPAIACC